MSVWTEALCDALPIIVFIAVFYFIGGE